MVKERIAAFLAAPGGGSFEELALAAFEFQYRRIGPYRQLCDRRGTTPDSVDDWRRVPAVPALAFKSLELAAAPARETFRSSGTTAPSRSAHHHPFPDLYRRAIDASFPAACLPHLHRPPALSLIPDRDQAPDSSLAFMVDHILARWAGEGTITAFGAAGVEVKRARGWLAARQRDGRPALVLATAFALARLLEALAGLDLRFRLPPGTTLFETGGFKGRRREISRPELLAAVADRLGIPGERVVREYGMTELTSQFYTRVLAGGDPDLFVAPHWVRVRVLSPESLEEAPPGSPGLLCIFDLANAGSAVHILTDDLGLTESGGFRLLGRAAGAELRGCSLAVEELGSGPGSFTTGC